MMVIDFTGRFNGEAFVAFENLDDAANALQRHKQKISSRFVYFSLDFSSLGLRESSFLDSLLTRRIQSHTFFLIMKVHRSVPKFFCRNEALLDQPKHHKYEQEQ